MTHQRIHNSSLSSGRVIDYQDPFFTLWRDKGSGRRRTEHKGSDSVNPSVGTLTHDVTILFSCAGLKWRWSRTYRRAVSQLRGSLRVGAVGPLAQRFGQLSLLHGSADALLSGCVASVQPGGGEKAGIKWHHASPKYSVWKAETGPDGISVFWTHTWTCDHSFLLTKSSEPKSHLYK